MITLISAAAGIQTSYPFEGYGGIERIVAQLAHTLSETTHGVRVVAMRGSHIPNVQMVEVGAEGDMANLDFNDGPVFDFSHMKYYLGDKISIPFWSDNMGSNPLFPTKAVKWAFDMSWGDIIYPGIDLSQYHPEKKEDYYLFMSRIAPYKGTHEAIYIAKKLGINLKIAGHSGKYADPTYAEWIKEQCTGKIEYVGDIDEVQKRDLLAKARGLLFLPKWSALRFNIPRPIESFGIVAVEAMASGTPVFTDDTINGHTEIINKTGGGLIIGDNDWKRILDFKVDPDKLAKKAQYFSIERYAKELIEYAENH